MDMMIGRGARYMGFVLRTTSGFVPKFSLGSARCICHCDTRQQNIQKYDPRFQWKTTGSNIYSASSNVITSKFIFRNTFVDNGIISLAYSSKTPEEPSKDSQNLAPPVKPTIFQKMKQLARDYWHILIPVHVVTSIGWVSIFYTAAQNGVDVVSILESLNMSERYLDMLRGSNAGHWAVTYALYKLFTPIRYTVTVGGTTMSIRYLDKWGYLKFKPKSTIKETQSAKSAEQHREKGYVKTQLKDQQQTESPKT